MGSSVFQVTSVSLEVVVCSVFAGFFPLPPFPGQESRKLQVTLSTPRGWACGQIAYAICQEGKAQTRSPQGSSSPSHGWLLPVPILLNLHSKGLVPCPRKEAPHSCRTTASGCSRGPASSKMGSTGACGKILCPTPKLGFWHNPPGLALRGKDWDRVIPTVLSWFAGLLYLIQYFVWKL